MSDSKNSMIFFYDWQNLFEELTDAEIGQLVMAALKYDQTGEDTKFNDKGMRVAFKAMKNSIKVSNEKYQTACEKKREAMERRWKKNRDAYISIDNYRESSDTDTVTDTVTDTDTETVTDTESGSGSGTNSAPTPPTLSDQDVTRIIKVWNNCQCTRNIQSITGVRLWATKKVSGEVKGFLQTIAGLDSQQYLLSQAKSGKPTEYDWFIKPENYQNVIEGKYKESFGGGGVGGLKRDWEIV